MKQYIKDNIIINYGDSIKYNGLIYVNPTDEQYKNAGWEDYIESEHIQTLDEAKAEMLEKITNYDVSSSVNGFILNGNLMWFDKADRVGLMNSTQILKDSGEENCTLWGSDSSYTISCDTLINMLSQLEVYALKCYNVTAQHKVEVNALTTTDEVNSYKYTEGYPNQLTFNI